MHLSLLHSLFYSDAFMTSCYRVIYVLLFSSILTFCVHLLHYYNLWWKSHLHYFFWNLPQSLTKHSGHCSCLTNIGSLPKGNNWQLGHKEFTVVHKIIKLIFYVPLRSDISKYFLILGEINSGSQTRRRTKCHTHGWLISW